MHRNTVDALWRRYQQFRTTRDRPRSGRPRVTSNRQDTYIGVVHLRYRLRTATLTARSIPGLSPRTVHNRLRERGIRPRRPAIHPVLQQRHRVAHVSPGVDDTYTSRNRTGHVFLSRMNPGFISTSATVVLECTVVLVNVSITGGVLSAEVVSWCGVKSYPVAEQLLWLCTAHLQASDIVTKSYGPMFTHLCNNITPRCNSTTLAHMSRWSSPTS